MLQVHIPAGKKVDDKVEAMVKAQNCEEARKYLCEFQSWGNIITHRHSVWEIQIKYILESFKW